MTRWVENKALSMLFLAFRFDIFRVLCVQKIASENQVFNKYSAGTCLLTLLDLSIFRELTSLPLKYPLLLASMTLLVLMISL